MRVSGSLDVVDIGAQLFGISSSENGIDDLQFGMVFVLSCMIGMITPPVGILFFMTAYRQHPTGEDIPGDITLCVRSRVPRHPVGSVPTVGS